VDNLHGWIAPVIRLLALKPYRDKNENMEYMKWLLCPNIKGITPSTKSTAV
jgi:hypothetical protein